MFILLVWLNSNKVWFFKEFEYRCKAEIANCWSQWFSVLAWSFFFQSMCDWLKYLVPFLIKEILFGKLLFARLIFLIGFCRSQLCTYEASGILKYLLTHCASHYFVLYEVSASCSFLIICRLLKKTKEFALILKHSFSYIITQIQYMREDFNRK